MASWTPASPYIVAKSFSRPSDLIEPSWPLSLIFSAAADAAGSLNSMPSFPMPSRTCAALPKRLARTTMMNFDGGSGTE